MRVAKIIVRECNQPLLKLKKNGVSNQRRRFYVVNVKSFSVINCVYHHVLHLLNAIY